MQCIFLFFLNASIAAVYYYYFIICIVSFKLNNAADHHGEQTFHRNFLAQKLQWRGSSTAYICFSEQGKMASSKEEVEHSDLTKTIK